jgi:hypothetical protein
MSAVCVTVWVKTVTKHVPLKQGDMWEIVDFRLVEDIVFVLGAQAAPVIWAPKDWTLSETAGSSS